MSDTPKILLIEDDVVIAGSLRRVLVRNGYDIEILTRGDEGLERAQRERFDVVLTDFKLPGLDGLELVKRLHAVRPLLPVIVRPRMALPKLLSKQRSWALMITC
jgi:two-component system OmpR family response regulator